MDAAVLEAYSNAADSLAESDIVDKKIHGSNQEWSLAPLHGIFSCVLPAHYASGALGGRIEFSSWLGQNSKTGKNLRILTEISMHMCLHTSGGKSEIRQAYFTPLVEMLTSPLLKHGVEGISQVITLLDSYTILKEDFDQLLELGIGKIDGATLLSKIPTNVKSSLTRTYNKESHMIPYSIGGSSKKQVLAQAPSPTLEDQELDIVDDEEEKEDVDLAKDKMIKATKSAPKKTAASKKKSIPKKSSASKKRGSAVDEDSYDEGDGFVIDDDEDIGPKKRKK
jgi:replication factor C subunit 1